MADIYEVLEQLGIKYEKYEHPAVFTVAESEEYDLDIPGVKTKNLFLRNEKGNHYYLVIVEGEKRVDLRKLAKGVGVRRFSFASPEKLYEKLELTPGSVSPFGLINNLGNEVRVVVDKDLLTHKQIGFHPNINTATLVIKTEDLVRFFKSTNNSVEYLEL